MSRAPQTRVNCTRCDWTGTRYQMLYPGQQWSKTDKPCPRCGGHVYRGRAVDHKKPKP